MNRPVTFMEVAIVVILILVCLLFIDALEPDFLG